VRSESRSSARRARGRRRATVTSVFGELLLTAGVLVLLFVAWQLWLGDLIIGAQRNSEGEALTQQWAIEAGPTPEGDSTPGSTPGSDAGAAPDPASDLPAPGDIPVLPQPADAEIFGVLQVPRFGADYAVPIAGGVTRKNTLDHIGVGHYPDSPMPGEVGNVAFAAHRTTYGKPFADIASLRVGDAIVVETPDGWYTYRFRSLEYVKPDEISVLTPVPQHPELPAAGRYLTMTSCSPKFSLAERIVGYSVFESFTPRTDGPPASLTEGI
jgi:sortase A